MALRNRELHARNDDNDSREQIRGTGKIRGVCEISLRLRYQNVL